MRVPIDLDAVREIVADTGLTPVFDLEHLRDSINICLFRLNGAAANKKVPLRERTQAITEILDSAGVLLRHLAPTADLYTAMAIIRGYESQPTSVDGPPAPSMNLLAIGIANLAKAAEAALQNEADPQVDVMRRFVSSDLSEVYEKHFGRPVGRSRSPDGGEPYGPYIRFVESIAAFAHLGHLSRETIARYTNGKK